MNEVLMNDLMMAKAKQELQQCYAGQIGTSKPSPAINLHFNFRGPQLHDGLTSLKLLVERLEAEIEQRFQHACSGEYQTYSYRYEQPGFDEAYTVSA
jgi:hypothetical protein